MEVVLMIGLPSTGKSTYAKENYSSYSIISLDDIPRRNRRKEQRLIEENLKIGNSVVIADTNATRKTRAPHIKLAKKYGAKIIAIHIDYPAPFAIHLNNSRKNPVPPVAIFHTNKILERPSSDEGFDEIIVKKLNSIKELQKLPIALIRQRRN